MDSRRLHAIRLITPFNQTGTRRIHAECLGELARQSIVWAWDPSRDVVGRLLNHQSSMKPGEMTREQKKKKKRNDM